MIYYKDSGTHGRVRLSEIPDLIRTRTAFDTEQHRLYAFNDVAGNYGVYSYGKPVLVISPQGTVQATKGYVYKGHLSVLAPFMEGGRL